MITAITCTGLRGKYKGEQYSAVKNKQGNYLLLPHGEGNRPDHGIEVSTLEEATKWLKRGWLIRVKHDNSAQTASRCFDALTIHRG